MSGRLHTNETIETIDPQRDAFPNRLDHVDQVSTRQCARLDYECVTTMGLRREEYGRGQPRPEAID